MNRYEKLAGNIAQRIRAGSLKANDRLPSVRELKSQMGISASTVFSAYYLLEAQGLVEARQRSGYFVRARAEVPANELAASEPVLVHVGRCLVAGLSGPCTGSRARHGPARLGFSVARAVSLRATCRRPDASAQADGSLADRRGFVTRKRPFTPSDLPPLWQRRDGCSCVRTGHHQRGDGSTQSCARIGDAARRRRGDRNANLLCCVAGIGAARSSRGRG